MSWIADILELLNVRQERKKRELEVEKLQRESSPIQIANDEQIAKVDPKRRDLLRKIKETSYPFLLSFLLAILALLVSLLALLVRIVR